MQWTLRCLVVFSACVGLGNALALPSYVKACSRHDPNLNDCALRSGQKAIPNIVKGDRKYRVPNMSPLIIENIEVINDGSGSRSAPVGAMLLLRNVKIYGIPDAVLRSVKIDLKQNKASLDAFFPKIELQNEYEVTGRVLLLPIKGQGPGNITVVGGNLLYAAEWDLKKMDDGKDHIVFRDPRTDLKVERLHVKLENLFGGNKLLGDNMNQFLDENWKDVLKDVGPLIVDAFSHVITQLVNNISELVPYDEIFPDKP